MPDSISTGFVCEMLIYILVVLAFVLLFVFFLVSVNSSSSVLFCFSPIFFSFKDTNMISISTVDLDIMLQLKY